MGARSYVEGMALFHDFSLFIIPLLHAMGIVQYEH